MAAPDIREKRRMLSLTRADQVQIIQSLPPGQSTFGCLKCCHAPDCCWCLGAVPFSCCKLPKDTLDKLEESKYIWIRENSIEFNQPIITYKDAKCCIPINPCALDVVDEVTVLYLDSPVLDKITNKTRCCNECRTTLCGGEGQRVQIANVFCSGCCLVGKNGVCCCPTLCPDCVTRPCTQQFNIHCQDADNAVYEIKKARTNAKARMGLE